MLLKSDLVPCLVVSGNILCLFSRRRVIFKIKTVSVNLYTPRVAAKTKNKIQQEFTR